MSALENAVRFGGFVLAHAAWIASDLQDSELICPIVVVTRGDAREVIPFEAESQAEAISMGNASLEELKNSVDAWALAREGLFSIPNGDAGKKDVLTVSSWVEGLDEPITLQQLFNPNSKGEFGLIGGLIISVHGQIPPEDTHSKLRHIAMQGVIQHPHGKEWNRWATMASN